jgi:two-component system NarL family sensor kinase
VPASPELTTLTALAQALSRSADLAESLDAALATVAEVLGLETGWVWLLDDDSNEPLLAAARALPTVLRDHPDAMRGDCYCLSTFRAGDLRGAANVNVVRCSRLDAVASSRTPGLETGLRCHASVPLSVGDRHIGMLNVASRDWRVLSDDELNLLTTAGALVSLAIERSRLEAAGARALAAEERNRLAREIHDTIAQALAALTMQLEVADSLAGARSDGEVTAAVQRALMLARSTLDEARRSVLDLRESPLDGRPLPSALEELAARIRAAGDGTTTVELSVTGFDDTGAELPPAVEIGLYRIAQQAVANAIAHAHAGRVDVCLTRQPRVVTMRIEDDGVGFNPAVVPAGRYGLVGMAERARLLGGSLSIDTEPGSGTAIHVTVPLGPVAADSTSARL